MHTCSGDRSIMGTVCAVSFKMPDFATLNTTGPVLPDLDSHLSPSIGNRVRGLRAHKRLQLSLEPEDTVVYRVHLILKLPLIDSRSVAPNEVTHGTKADRVLAMDVVVANASRVPSTKRTRPVLSLCPLATLLARDRRVVIGRRAEPDSHDQRTNPHYRRQDSDMVCCHKGADHQRVDSLQLGWLQIHSVES